MTASPPTPRARHRGTGWRCRRAADRGVSATHRDLPFECPESRYCRVRTDTRVQLQRAAGLARIAGSASTASIFAVENMSSTIRSIVFQEQPVTGEPHVISALSNKRAELAGIVSQLERQLGQQVDLGRASLAADAHRFCAGRHGRAQFVRQNEGGFVLHIDVAGEGQDALPSRPGESQRLKIFRRSVGGLPDSRFRRDFRPDAGGVGGAVCGMWWLR